MIQTTRGPRHVVAVLAAALLTGVLGLVSVAALTRAEAQRSSSTVVDAESSTTQHRATVAAPQHDDHHVTVDLSGVTPANAMPLLAAVVAAAAAARVAARRSTVPATATGRAPPRR